MLRTEYFHLADCICALNTLLESQIPLYNQYLSTPRKIYKKKLIKLRQEIYMYLKIFVNAYRFLYITYLGF